MSEPRIEDHRRVAAWQQGLQELRRTIESNPGATALNEAIARFVERNAVDGETLKSPGFRHLLAQEGGHRATYLDAKLTALVREKAPPAPTPTVNEARPIMVGEKTVDIAKRDALANDIFKLARLQPGASFDSWSYPLRKRDEALFRSTLKEIVRSDSELHNQALEEVGSTFIADVQQYLDNRPQAQAA